MPKVLILNKTRCEKVSPQASHVCSVWVLSYYRNGSCCRFRIRFDCTSSRLMICSVSRLFWFASILLQFNCTFPLLFHTLFEFFICLLRKSRQMEKWTRGGEAHRVYMLTSAIGIFLNLFLPPTASDGRIVAVL